VRTRALVTGPLVPINVRGSSYEGLFHAADWMPTILSVAGLSHEDGLDGIDQWPAIKGLAKPPRDEVIIHVDTSSFGMTGAIRRGRWKLLLNVKREPVYDRTSVSAPLDWLADEAATYLYDVEADPAEAVDLSAANPDIVDELSKRLVDVHAHAAEPLYCAPTRDEDEKARAAFAANGNRLGPWAPLSTDRSHCDDDGADREALLAEACASGRMLASSCARALAAAAAG
jgi:arylsulfatase A-like enzyme